MQVYEAIKERRTIRIFDQKAIKNKDLLQIIDCARLAPFGANIQSLKYKIVSDEKTRRAMFPYIKYAGYIPDWNPKFEQTPTTFIVVVNDTKIKPTATTECASGAAIMSMCLGAKELGIDSCWLGAIDRKEIKTMLKLDEEYDITYLLGLGYPAQSGKAVDMTDSIKYYFDKDKNVYVPKMRMEDVLIK